MHGYVNNIERLALENDTFRTELYTDQRSHLVVMSLRPREEIGDEVHEVDQLLRVEQGSGKAIVNGVEH